MFLSNIVMIVIIKYIIYNKFYFNKFNKVTGRDTDDVWVEDMKEEY